MLHTQHSNEPTSAHGLVHLERLIVPQQKKRNAGDIKTHTADVPRRILTRSNLPARPPREAIGPGALEPQATS